MDDDLCDPFDLSGVALSGVALSGVALSGVESSGVALSGVESSGVASSGVLLWGSDFLLGEDIIPLGSGEMVYTLQTTKCRNTRISPPFFSRRLSPVKKKRDLKVVLNERNEKMKMVIPGRIIERTKWKKLLHW